MATRLVGAETADADRCALGHCSKQRDRLARLGLLHLAFVSRKEASSHRGFVEAFPRRSGEQFPTRREHRQPAIKLCFLSPPLARNAAGRMSRRRDAQAFTSFRRCADLKGMKPQRFFHASVLEADALAQGRGRDAD